MEIKYSIRVIFRCAKTIRTRAFEKEEINHFLKLLGRKRTLHSEHKLCVLDKK